ncbi:hypothetical protein HMPREF1531_00984 [Propionibacterium sp. oral taxon 192 str. F0372]|uniref:beta-ketoacyl synthase N-terminal-like domain-containing protein n=1 Tax=Propionibacterium sp. oral taxon 192 TaxID=671222 RepID=UPI00035358D4|nr:beta-ketoacyl synthase N-terminal-like domain-containing protein [Propionibacterium sp. oral taxon 192]EPH05555.1 hypothetical protein HMPREF1531_00984 [Propionibacterium sp. oral taxon 192 str. F0372]
MIKHHDTLAVWDIAVRCSAGSGTDPVFAVLTEGSVLQPQIEDFNIRKEVGPKGTRTLDRSAGLALAAMGQLGRLATIPAGRDDVGIVLATSFGSIASTIQFTQESLSGDRPYLVDPSRFPNTVMNFAASQGAIRHGLRGPNATLIAGAGSALHGLDYCWRLIELGQADALILGGVEEWTPERVQLEHDAGSRGDFVEGAAALLVGPSALWQETPLARVSMVLTGVVHDSDSATQLVRRWRTNLPTEAPEMLIRVGHSVAIDRLLDALAIPENGLDTPTRTLALDSLGDLGAWGSALALTLAAEVARSGTRARIVSADERGPVSITDLNPCSQP